MYESDRTRSPNSKHCVYRRMKRSRQDCENYMTDTDLVEQAELLLRNCHHKPIIALDLDYTVINLYECVSQFLH